MGDGKKPHKNKPTSKKYTKYKIEGDKIVSREKTCPRCGPGVFLMKADNRSYCGRCHYTEFMSKTKEVPKEAKVEEKKE
jgi:ubiquitin-small subunit ribosomal protein S27Ae